MSPTLDATQFGTLDAHYPVLLLPVSVQVKFVPTPTSSTPYELRVRIYPDQLGISTHEAPLTADELAAAHDYWRLAPAAAQPGQGGHSLDHWRPLVARYGAPRAQWLLHQTTPQNLAAVLDDPANTAPDFPDAGNLATERWTRAAQARALPERFTVLLYNPAPDRAALAASPVLDQLFPVGGATAYAPGLVPEPTTEFLTLSKVLNSSIVTKDALAVGLAPPTNDPTAASLNAPAPSQADLDAEATAPAIGGIDVGNRWTVDFDQAEAKGMAVRVPLTQDEYQAGFRRLVVLGVRAAGTPTDATATAEAGQQAVQQLFTEHYYSTGLGLVPQGTPTNNTDAVAAGYNSRERLDADASFALLTQASPAAQPWATRFDGQHLRTALGLRQELPPLAGALGQDARLAQVFNQALWPATYGYFLDEMLRGLFSADALKWTRAFFENYVLARGAVPALRVGAQPYGVLPTTRFSAWEVPNAAANPYPERLRQTLAQLDVTWTERLNPQKDYYGPTLTGGAQPLTVPGTPPDTANLLSTLGLDATSTEYYQRYLIGPALADAFNQAAGEPSASDHAMWADPLRRFAAFAPTANPFYQEFARHVDPSGNLLPASALPIFERVFQSTYTKLADAFADEPAATRHEGLLLDGQPLSEDAFLVPLLGVEKGGPNYAQWLATASFEEIRTENFTAAAQSAPDAFLAPTSLLYRLLRQAVLRQYWEAAKALRTSPPSGATLSPELLALDVSQEFDKELFNIDTLADKARWSWLYATLTPAGSAAQPLHKYLQDNVLGDYLAAVAALGQVPTAQLERLLAEHLDLGSYRLDAWRLAQVAERLDGLRQTQPTGSHLGAFGWLENVLPGDHSTPDAQEPAVRHDPDNLGYLHAPSLTHGTAGAILRQGYKARQHTADPADPASERMAVDISSRRVRHALALLEGVRAGHSLGALLGQSLERALQQAPTPSGGTPFVQYIAQFRQRYPLADEHALVPGPNQTAPTGLAPEQAARQVVDGAALLRGAGAGYPFGMVGLPTTATNPDFVAFATAQVAELVDDLDALGDLAVSEGIFQAARGNADRAGAVLESVAKGQFPVSPDVVRPAQRSLSYTQRVLVHLPYDISVPAWPQNDTPRLLAAPRLNGWLAQFFPDPSGLSFSFDYQGVTTPPAYAGTLYEAGLHAIDLLYLLDDKALQAGSAFDRLLLLAVGGKATGPAPTPGAPLAVDYSTGTGPAALRRLLPLLARLRQLVGGARPARPHDLQAPTLLSADPYDGATLPTFNAAKTKLTQVVTDLAPGSTADQRVTLGQAALYGLAEAPAALADGASLAAGAATVRAAAQARLDAADAVRAAYVEANATAAVPQPALDGAALLEVAAAYFGPGFRPDVEFALSGDARTAYDAAVAPSAAAQLLRYSHDQPDPAQNNPLALQEWLHGVATVREPLAQLDKVFLLNGLLNPDVQYACPTAPQGSPLLPLQPAQYAATTTDDNGLAHYWLGLPWDPAYAPPGDALSLLQWLPADYKTTDAQAALWLDEWAETLPLASQTTALTFHYDQPNSAAPQTMLLVVPPRADRAQPWRPDDLLGAVNETLDLAKKRTVEPDALAFTHLATVLPAVVAPVAQQAVTFTLDLGSINDTARFAEQVLAP